jgi:hypothetical protein
LVNHAADILQQMYYDSLSKQENPEDRRISECIFTKLKMATFGSIFVSPKNLFVINYVSNTDVSMTLNSVKKIDLSLMNMELQELIVDKKLDDDYTYRVHIICKLPENENTSTNVRQICLFKQGKALCVRWVHILQTNWEEHRYYKGLFRCILNNYYYFYKNPETISDLQQLLEMNNKLYDGVPNLAMVNIYSSMKYKTYKTIGLGEYYLENLPFIVEPGIHVVDSSGKITDTSNSDTVFSSNTRSFEDDSDSESESERETEDFENGIDDQDNDISKLDLSRFVSGGYNINKYTTKRSKRNPTNTRRNNTKRSKRKPTNTRRNNTKRSKRKTTNTRRTKNKRKSKV